MNSGDHRSAPAASEVAVLLNSLQDQFDWPTRAERYEPVQNWERSRSGTVFFRMTGMPSGPAVLVKTGTGWDRGAAEHLYAAMVDLADTISPSGIEGAHTIRPLAWAPSPPVVVMPYVSGTDLVTMLRDPGREEWAHMGPWMGRAGAMLAVYHASHPIPQNADIAPAGDEVREAGRRMRIPPHLLENLMNEIDWRHCCAFSFGDFGPGNLLGTGDGDLYLLDPPEHPAIALIHKDIGNFLFELRRQLGGHGYTRTRPVRGRFNKLRTEFLEGYSDRSSNGLGSYDESLVALFEMRRAVGMARKRFPNRPVDGAWFAGSALARRREVLRAARHS